LTTAAVPARVTREASFPTRWPTVAAAVLMTLVAAFIGWRLVGGADEAQVTLVTDLTFPVAAGLAILLAFGASRATGTDGRDRRAWRLLGLALVCYGLGDVMWAALEIGTGEGPDVSIADAFYLLYYPTALAGLASLPGAARTRAEQAQLAIDALSLVIVGTTIEWILVISPQVGDLAISPAATIVALAYPIGDVVLLLGLGMVVLRRRVSRHDLPLVLMVGAVVANLAGDLVSGSAWLDETYVTGGLPDMAFMLFWMLIGLAAYAQGRPEAALRQPVDRPPSSVFWLPYAAIGVGFALPIASELGGWEAARGSAIAGAISLSVLVATRQLLGAREAARHAGERARAATESRFNMLVQQASDIIMVIARDGTVRFASPSTRRIAGMDPGDVVGRNLIELVGADDRQAMQAYLGDAGAGSGPATTIEWQLDAGEAGPKRVESIAANLLDDPDVQGLVLTTRDITDRTRLEHELSEARRLESIGRLAGGVAHDFNNLLTGIGGFAELVIEDMPAGDPRREDVLQIKHAADQATRLTAQLLAVGRRQVIHPVPVDLAEVVRGSVPLIRQVTGESVRVVTHLAADGATVLADRNQIGQVLLNLAANARDAMPGGGVLTITVDRARFAPAGGPQAGSDDGPAVMLAVADTGTGMDPETLAQVFEPFFTTKEQGKGTGLGLASVYGIVQMANGRVEVESELGRGSVFRVYLRETSAEGDVEAASAAAAGLGQRGRRILLVEDEGGVRSFAERALQRAGHRVIAFAHPSEALAHVLAASPPLDALVTDVVMPGMSGPDLAARVLAIRPGLPVLYTSGNVQLDLPGPCLAKPFTASGLAAAVNDVLAAAGPAAGVAGPLAGAGPGAARSSVVAPGVR
jgi:PAS domain S-box-containing protein